MRRLYLRACKKTMLSLHFSGWDGSLKVLHSQWVFCTGLWRVCGLLLCGSSCLGRISLGVFKDEFDCGEEVVHEILHGLELFNSAQEDQGDVVYESLPEEDCPDKGIMDGFFVVTHEEVGTWWSSFGSTGSVNKLEKMPTHE